MFLFFEFHSYFVADDDEEVREVDNIAAAFAFVERRSIFRKLFGA